MPAKLTEQQRQVLRALNMIDVWARGEHLPALMIASGTPAGEVPPIAGVHRTLASLIRRGLVSKTTISGHVNYRITMDGIEVLG